MFGKTFSDKRDPWNGWSWEPRQVQHNILAFIPHLSYNPNFNSIFAPTVLPPDLASTGKAEGSAALVAEDAKHHREPWEGGLAGDGQFLPQELPKGPLCQTLPVW